ncbi:unnamed protein product, partial [marine sediment metagenome]
MRQIDGDAEAAIPELERVLQGIDVLAKIRAISTLGNIGSDRCVQLLEAALGDASAEVRETAAKALESIGRSAHATTATLERTLDDPSDPVRLATAVALWQIAGAASLAAPVLIEMLKPNRPFKTIFDD